MRVDYQLSDKQSLFARFLIARQDAAVPYTLAPNNVLTAGGVGNNDQETALTLGDTYLFSASTVNSVRLFANRIAAQFPGAKMFGPENVGINSYTYQPNYLSIPVTGGFSLGSGNASENSFANTTDFGVNEDVSIIHGSHLFAFGGYFMRTIEWSVAQFSSGGVFTVSGGTTGLGLSDFMMGDVAQFRNGNPNPLNLSQNFGALYAQDTWKITPRLTMNIGVNWDPFLAISFQQGDVYSFNLGNFQQGIRSKVIPGAPPGFLYPGDPGFYGTSGIHRSMETLIPGSGSPGILSETVKPRSAWEVESLMTSLLRTCISTRPRFHHSV